MKKILFVLCAVVAVVAFNGCSTTNTSQGAYTPEIKVQNAYTADIQMDNKVVAGAATVHNLFGIFTWGVTEFADDAFVVSTQDLPFSFFIPADVAAKEGATFNALEDAKADVLLGAKYKVVTDDFFVYKKVNCRAYGYPGTIKGVKAVK